MYVSIVVFITSQDYLIALYFDEYIASPVVPGIQIQSPNSDSCKLVGTETSGINSQKAP